MTFHFVFLLHGPLHTDSSFTTDKPCTTYGQSYPNPSEILEDNQHIRQTLWHTSTSQPSANLKMDCSGG